MEKKMNTTITFEFFDGTTTKMTLTFYKLLQLKNNNRALYMRYNEAMRNSNKNSYDELETLVILYTAHVCANPENYMTEEDFIYKCGSDRTAVAQAIKQLIQPKKQKVSDNRSSTEQETGKAE